MERDAGRTEQTVRLKYDNHIHITGMARTGTTLMKNLMACFEGVVLGTAECKPDEFLPAGASIVVTKLPGGGPEIYESYPGVRIIHMIRDPRDTFCSKMRGSIDTPPERAHLHHIDEERRLPGGPSTGVVGTWRMAQDPRTFVVRYEELVTTPNRVQTRISEHFGLVPRLPFSEGYTIFPNEQQDSNIRALNGVRPPDPSEIGRWRRPEYKSLVEDWLNKYPYLKDIIREMGYGED